MSRIHILLCFGLLSFQSWGQISTLKETKEAVDTLFFSNEVEALELSEKMLPLAFQAKDTFYITYFLDQAGELNRVVGNYEKAINQITKCLKYKVNWEDKRDLSLSYNNLGKTYMNTGQYELAASNFLKALKIMELSKDLQGQAYYLNNLGALYDLQHNYDRAIGFYSRSLNIKLQLKDDKGVAATHTNLGISYYNLGNYKKAIASYEIAIRTYREFGTEAKLARSLSNLGKVYLEQKDFKKAKSFLIEGYRLKEKISDAQLISSLTNNLSAYYIASNQLDSALVYNQQALDLATSTGSLSGLRDAYVNRAEIYAAQKSYSSAYEALQIGMRYNDSLVNEANIYAVADIEGKYNYEKNTRVIKEKELENVRSQKEIQEQKSMISSLILGLSILILIAALLVIRFQQKKRKAELLLGQNKLIQKQKIELEAMNSRLSNELDQLHVSVEEKERLLNEVFNSAKQTEMPPELLALSKREMEVLGYLALGRSDDEIAQSLFLSKSTVKTHLRRIYSKLLVKSRSEAVAIAHKHALFSYEEV